MCGGFVDSSQDCTLVRAAQLNLLVDENWDWIFREQLSCWMNLPDLWPTGLTREMFPEWFDCELTTVIWAMLLNRIRSVSGWAGKRYPTMLKDKDS